MELTRTLVPDEHALVRALPSASAVVLTRAGLVSLFVGGCSGRIGTVAAEMDGDAGAPDAPTDAAPSIDSEGADGAESGNAVAYVPPTWFQVNANIISGDIVSIWGSGPSDLYVGEDTGTVTHLRNRVPLAASLARGAAVGAGWASDSHVAYGVGACAWLAQQGLSAAGGLYHVDPEGLWQLDSPGTFFSVWGSSPSDLYVGGPAGISHAIGGAPLVAESSAGTDVLAVWGSGAGDVFATTTTNGGSVRHSSGDGNWQTVLSNMQGQPFALWGSGPGDVYALFSATPPSSAQAYVAHSSPTAAWRIETIGAASTTLVALWGSGSQDVYAGGWHQDASGKTGVLFHSAGDGQWLPVPLPDSTYDVRAIWGSSATDVYVGVFDIEAGPVLLHSAP